MTEIDQKIIETIVQLLHDGGQYAMVGVIGWFVYQLARIALIGGVIWLLARLLSSTVISLTTTYQTSSERKITLVSEECSSRLTNSIVSLETTITESLGCLEKKIDQLKPK